MDIVTRKQLNILIQLAEADKHFATKEREKIFKIAKAHNFPKEEVELLIRHPEPIGTFGALSDNQRFEYLYNTVDLMLEDKKVFESEILFCKDIAIKLGFKKDIIEFMVKEMSHWSKEKLRAIALTEYS